MRKKYIVAMLAAAVILTGCGHQNSNRGEGGKIPQSDKKEVHSATATSSAIPAADPETAIPSLSPAIEKTKREDVPVEYAEANYFKEKVKDILYYRDGKRYTILPDTRQGKQIILLTKMRYVNTGEHVLRKNKLKKRCSDLQQKGKALEIRFVKSCFTIYTGSRSNDYKKVSINYQSWFYPLEGKEVKYFLPLPNKECTYEKLGDAKSLLDYLEKSITK